MNVTDKKEGLQRCNAIPTFLMEIIRDKINLLIVMMSSPNLAIYFSSQNVISGKIP